MERSFNPRIEKQSIYEIYRACRLCGAGAGYKMPIIQNVIDLDDQEVQLKQKIRDCVQIEVHQDDKMPPLICELCVDKVNDFYEFLDMCKQTNIRTRLRLGLPPQSLPRGAPDAGDCILGLTETVYINSDEDEPLVKRKRPQPSQKSKLKKEPEVRVQIEKCPAKIEPRITRHKTKREPTPPRVTRNSKSSEIVATSRLQDTAKSSRSLRPAPKSILKKEEKSKSEDTSLLTPRVKRPYDKKDHKTDMPHKKVKIAVPSPPPARRRPASPPPAAYLCKICHLNMRNGQGLASHMKSHTVGFTSAKLSCNACATWFRSGEEALNHHRQHRRKGRPYTCRRCTADFLHQQAYDEHFAKNQCIPYDVVPDVKCSACWQQFPTRPLLTAHKCLGEDGRPGGKCVKCNRSYLLLKNLKRHEATCPARRKGELIVDPALLGKLKPIQVRVARCDPLLTNVKQEHYDVSSVSSDFGLDPNCTYPYISSVSSLRIKSEPEDFDSMVTIKQEIKEEFCTEENFVHWDSASESESDPEVTGVVLNPFPHRNRIHSLSSLSLKAIFSQRFLGKVPKKRRRVKTEHGFDSLLATNDVDDSVRRDIDTIINNLGNDDDTDAGSDLSRDCSNDVSKDVSNDANVTNDLLKDIINDGNVTNDLLKDVINDGNVTNDSLKDVINDANVTNDLLKDVINDASSDVTISDSNVLSTDNGLSKVISDVTVVNASNETTKDKGNDIIVENVDVSREDSNSLSMNDRDESNEAIKKYTDASENDGNHLSKDDSNDVIEKDDRLNDEDVKIDAEITFEHSRDCEMSLSQDFSAHNSPSLLELSSSGDLCNDSPICHSENNVSTELADVTNENDDSDEKKNESNDKCVDVCNDSSMVAVNNELELANESKDISPVKDSLEKATENEVDFNKLKEDNICAGLIENNIVKNGSLHDVCNGTETANVTIKNVDNDHNSNLSGHSESHNRIEQTTVSNDNINDDSLRKNDEEHVINDRIDVINDSISPGRIENKEINLHVDNESNDDTAAVDNENTSQFDCDSDAITTCNNDRNAQIVNSSNLDTANIESKTNDKPNDTESLNDNDYCKETKSTEDEDRRLMEELDARIAENTGLNESNDKADVSNDKITLDDLIQTRGGDNSLGLDSISDDDFNFDN